MKIAILQNNYIVGDLAGNSKKIFNSVKKASEQNVDLCITTELSLLGYPPRDLLFDNDFLNKVDEAYIKLINDLKGFPATIIGSIERNLDQKGKPLFNTAFLVEDGKTIAKYHKNLLPTYDVFDEDRYFNASNKNCIVKIKNSKIGITICEDIWNDKDFWNWNKYISDPIEELTKQNIDLIINISASPFTIGKHKVRENMLSHISKKYSLPIIYTNQIGGNDDLVFDGRSCVFNRNGELIARALEFEEDLLIFELDVNNRVENYSDLSEKEVWNALVLGTRDYIYKSGFKSVVLGLSGGIDSALTAVIAAEAIGKENVLCVMMPSPYSSEGSIADSVKLANINEIKTHTLNIESIMGVFKSNLDPIFQGLKEDTTEENIQSRIRGNLLMAISNKFGSLLLTTGNKSEISVGYCTIYGDMSGGLGVISDVPKTMVYKICKWLNNAKGEIIPKEIINKPPSAELKPGQTDQDSLPPYEILDEIIYRFIEKRQTKEDIISSGIESNTVNRIINLICKAEFKRKQSPPGLKVTDVAFGTGWRMPIAKKYNF